MAVLQYTEHKAPEEAQLVELKSGIYWARMPLPFPPKHINVYLLEGDDGWTVIDTGMNLPEAREQWLAIFDRHLGNKPVTAVVATHMHFDHCGLSTFLTDHWRAPLWMSRGEYLAARSGRPKNRADSWQLQQHYQRAGMDDQYAQRVAEKFESFEKVHEPVPLSYERLQEGQLLHFGNDAWQVMMGLGHSPEHACLYSEDSGVLISGDHILPRISPNISVSAECPGADPLTDYLDTLLPFANLPEDTLVLPSHGLPFRQLHLRIEQLQEDHQGNLDKLLSLCRNESSLKQIIPGIFTRKLSPVEYHLAMGESLALVNRLWHLGLLERRLDDQGVFLYKAC